MPQKSLLLHTELLRKLSLLYHKSLLDKLSSKSKKSSAETLLKYAGTWSGNDLEDCLEEVIHSRGESQF